MHTTSIFMTASRYFVILILLYISQIRANLICNGDFQKYMLSISDLSSDNNVFNFANIINNRSCWYTATPNFSYFQVMTTPSLNITKVGATIGQSKNLLCQNVSLEVNATYQLIYQIIPDFSIASCNVSFSRSGFPYYIGSYQSSNISYLVDLQFTALYPYQQICFFPDNITYKNTFLPSGTRTWGPMLDNVSLSFFTRPIKTAQVNFCLTYNPIDNQITLQSDFCFQCLSQYSLPISYFNSIQIKIEDNEESNFVVAVDSQNFLKVVVDLKLQYDHQNFKSIELAIPNAAYLHFDCLIDGRPTNVSSQSEQSRFVKAVLPGAKFVSQTIRDVFNLLNTFVFSYFIVNLISFYNITLLYYFLHLKTLPGFVRSFFLSLAYIFFKRGSVLDQVQRFGWIPNDFQFDFSTLNIIQKMDLYKNESKLWFAYYDIYTNFAQSNIEPIILLSFLLFKFFLLKFVVSSFSMIKTKANLKWGRFFHIFSKQFSCFTPFLIISSVTSLTNVSELYFAGKLNSVTQILIIFIIIFVPLLSFLYSKHKNQNMKANLRKNRNSLSLNKLRPKINMNLLQASEELTVSIMSFYIPFCITIQSPPIFFVFTTPLILKKIIASFRQRKVLSCFNNLIKFFTTLAWANYHFSFLGLYVIQLILKFNEDLSRQRTEDITTFLGYTIIISILMGGFFDMLNSFAEFIHSVFHFYEEDMGFIQEERYCSLKERENRAQTNEEFFQIQIQCQKSERSLQFRHQQQNNSYNNEHETRVIKEKCIKLVKQLEIEIKQQTYSGPNFSQIQRQYSRNTIKCRLQQKANIEIQKVKKKQMIF